jgi:hypothetical protein
MINKTFAKIRISFFPLLIVIVLLPKLDIWAQTYPNRTVGLLMKDSLAFEGYTLFTPNNNTTTYLINNDGLLVHSWESDYRPGQSVYLLEDGNLLRTANVNNQTFTAGGSGGRVQIIEWDGTVAWDYLCSGSKYCQHHDVEILPDGNVLLIVWEYKSVDSAIAAGRSPDLLKQNELWPDYIIEVQPSGTTTGDIVWEWHAWDHLIQDYDSSKENYGVVADHPELIDLNFVLSGPNAGNADWNHTNSVAYNEEFDQIILSVHNFNEIWVIDHSTSTEEAASHTGGNSGKGGDILYRWGNPQTYDTGDNSDKKLYGQHDTQWIGSGCPGEGNILIFNNGTRRNYSTVDEIVPPVDSAGNYFFTPNSAYAPEEPLWIYTAENPTDFYSQNISGAQRLANGNTLVCSGANGIFFEVSPNTNIVWYYINPVTADGPLIQGDSTSTVKNMVFKIRRYAPDYVGLAGHDLTPGDPIEIYSTNIENRSGNLPLRFRVRQNYPNPFNPTTSICYELPVTGMVQLTIYNIMGQEVKALVDEFKTAGYFETMWDGTDNLGRNVDSGIYFYKLQSVGQLHVKKMILVR